MIRLFIYRYARRLAVEADSENDGPRLRHVEEVVALQERRRTGEVRLRIEAAVAPPCVEVASRDAQVDARESESLDKWTIDRVGDRDFAEFRVAAVFRELLDDV